MSTGTQEALQNIKVNFHLILCYNETLFGTVYFIMKNSFRGGAIFGGFWNFFYS